MKKYLLFTLAISLFLSCGIQAQQVNTFLSLLEYVPAETNGYNSLIQTQNNGYLICRSATDTFYPPNNHWAEIIRTEVTGEVAWAKRFYQGFTPGVFEDANCSITELSDGNFVFVTSEYDSLKRPQICMFKLDYSGNVIWTKRISSGPAAYINKVQQTSDGGLVLAGSSLATTGGQDYAIAIKTDSAGNFVWGLKSYLPSDTVAVFTSFVEVPGTGYVFVGNCNNSSFLLCTGINGNVIWSKTTASGSSYPNIINSIIFTADNSLVITGQRVNISPYSKTFMIVKVDLSGNIIWAKKQLPPLSPPPFMDSYGSALVEKNNNYYFCGYVSNPYPATLFGAVDVNGNLLWTKQYWSDYHPFNYEPVSFIKTADGGFAFSLMSGTVPPIFATAFVKTDSNLEAGCGSSPYTMMLDTINISLTSNLVTSSTGSSANMSFTLSPFMPLQEFVCADILDSAGVGIEVVERAAIVSVYPNPANKFLYLKNVPVKNAVEIVNLSGATVLSANNVSVLDVSSLTAGIYFVRIHFTEGGEVRTVKFIKAEY